jgi:hypothetical protein
MMKELEPQLRQANPFCSITRRRHHASSPGAYMLARYHVAYLSAFRYLLLAFHRYDGLRGGGRREAGKTRGSARAVTANSASSVLAFAFLMRFFTLENASSMGLKSGE